MCTLNTNVSQKILSRSQRGAKLGVGVTTRETLWKLKFAKTQPFTKQLLYGQNVAATDSMIYGLVIEQKTISALKKYFGCIKIFHQFVFIFNYLADQMTTKGNVNSNVN